VPGLRRVVLAGELSAALANTARRDWMTLENLNTDMPVTEDFAQLPLPACGGRVRCRWAPNPQSAKGADSPRS